MSEFTHVRFKTSKEYNGKDSRFADCYVQYKCLCRKSTELYIPKLTEVVHVNGLTFHEEPIYTYDMPVIVDHLGYDVVTGKDLNLTVLGYLASGSELEPEEVARLLSELDKKPQNIDKYFAAIDKLLEIEKIADGMRSDLEKKYAEEQAIKQAKEEEALQYISEFQEKVRSRKQS